MTSPLELYRADVAPLRDRARAWRLALGLAMAVIGQVVATVLVLGTYALMLTVTTNIRFSEALNRATALDTPGSLIAVLLTFGGVTLAIWLAMKWLHRGRFRLLLGSGDGRVRQGFTFAAGLFLALGVLAMLIGLPFNGYQPNLTMGTWALWLLPALFVTFVQVSAEEVVFRGYLQAHLASRFRSPLIFVGIPTLIFGSAHASNAAAFGDNAWLVLLAPTLIGIMASHLTIRTGNLGAAIGLHFANNAIGLLLVAVPGPFGQLSLYTHPFDPMDVATVRPFILGNLAFLVLAYSAFLLLVPARQTALQRPADVFK